MGHRIETWARQTKHADGITWFLSKLETEAQGRPRQRVPVVRPHRQVRPGLQLGRFGHCPRRRGSDGSRRVLRIPFYLEYELRARHPQGSHCPLEAL